MKALHALPTWTRTVRLVEDHTDDGALLKSVTLAAWNVAPWDVSDIIPRHGSAHRQLSPGRIYPPRRSSLRCEPFLNQFLTGGRVLCSYAEGRLTDSMFTPTSRASAGQ